MTDFIIELEKLLRQSGYKDWGIRYIPEKDAYALKLDGDTILIKDIMPMPKFAGNAYERSDI